MINKLLFTLILFTQLYSLSAVAMEEKRDMPFMALQEGRAGRSHHRSHAAYHEEGEHEEAAEHEDVYEHSEQLR